MQGFCHKIQGDGQLRCVRTGEIKAPKKEKHTEKLGIQKKTPNFAQNMNL